MDCKSPHWPGGNHLPRGTKLKFGDSKPSEDGHHLQDCHHGLLQLRLERWQKQRKQTGGRGRGGGGGSGGGELGVNAETRGSFLQKINTFLGSNAVLRFCVLVWVYTRSFMPLAAMLIKQLMCFNVKGWRALTFKVLFQHWMDGCHLWFVITNHKWHPS